LILPLNKKLSLHHTPKKKRNTSNTPEQTLNLSIPVCDRVLIVASAAASGYHVVQLTRTLYLSRSTGDGGGCRRLSRAMACVSFFLDKVCFSLHEMTKRYN
jgi:hypothetical protein